MLNGLQPWHLIILVLLVVLLFGAKRLPDAARSIGKSMKIFKAETKGLRDDDDDDAHESRSDTAERSDVRPAPRVLPGTVEGRDQGTPQATEQQPER